jgi:alkylglycerol monooxygenase
MNELALLIPVFLFLAFAEWWLTRKSRPGQFSKENTALNICIGAIDRISSLASFALFVFVLQLAYEHWRIWTLEVTWYNWIFAYFAVDFVSYWYHRFSHRIAILWCGHVTHHSSDHYNLTNGFRTSPFQGLYRIPFWIILPIIGFSPAVLLIVFIVSGLYDFFLHTQNFPKIRWIELVLITPSLHKVHHGKNDIYIDKNYGATFIIWDRMFGTFQDETEQVQYGILSKEYKDGDPIDAIFHHYRYLWSLMKQTISWKNRLKVLIMPPDWIPHDVREVNASSGQTLVPDQHQVAYALVQFVISAIGILILLVCESRFSLLHFSLYAGFFLLGMISSTRLFNHKAGLRFHHHELFGNLLLMAVFSGAFFFSENGDYLLSGFALTGCYAIWSFRLMKDEKDKT